MIINLIKILYSFKNYLKEYIDSRRSEFLLSIFMLIRQQKLSFFLHYVNMVLSKSKYILFETNLNTLSAESFLANRFEIFNEGSKIRSRDKKLLNELLGICNFMENPANIIDATTKYVLLENFFFIQNSLRNQTHFDNIPSELISSLADSFRNSEIFAMAQSASGCKLTVCNLRCWLFYPRSKEVDTNINLHTDWFLSGFLKVMFYKGTFTQDSPALNVY